MRVRALLILVTFVLGFGDATRRRRVRSTTSATATTITTPALFVNRQFMFAEHDSPSEVQIQWDNYDILKPDARSKFWKNPNNTESHKSILSTGRQFYPGLPNPGDTNELPNPISPQASSVPPPQQPAPGCLGLRGQYPSPKSCANYLNCWDDVVIEQTCPAGLLFNDVTNVCDFDYNVNCGNRPLPTPKPPLPPGSKLCPDQNGRYRSSTNCSEFYVCVARKPIKFSCPRGLVYNDILNVCDYSYNVDCKGAVTPKPSPPHHPATQPPTRPSTNLPTLSSKPSTSSSKPTLPPKPSTYPPESPTYPSLSPTYPSPAPTYPPQPPTYAPQPPTYAPQPPNYPPQPPTYLPQPPPYQPQPPTYQPQPHPFVSYPGNPWLNKVTPDPWHQRPPASQLEIEMEKLKQEEMAGQPQELTETSSLIDPWNLFQVVPPELMKNPCNNGDVHRLNEACTSMVVCRNKRPQVVRCSPGFSYDKPSDSCKPFSVAKC